MVIGVALRGIGKIIKSQARKNRRKRLGLPAETYLQRQKRIKKSAKKKADKRK
jgi:hypothetical protein|tara:strand:+ start:218 stop:376 length:159 start_codon:yes stop_codon:yes gene_type:complete